MINNQINNAIKISIIIPVYNAEKYLKQCLDSVINQTLKNIEIICIDDNSSDNSLQILREYAQKDNRIEIIENKINLGPGKSRNKGIKIAKGEYIMFLDSDDWYDIQTCERMFNCIKNNDVDLCICRSQQIDDNNDINTYNLSYSIKTELLNNKNIFSPLEISSNIFQFCVGWPWDKIYKKELIDKYSLKFQNLQNSDDTFFVLFYLTISNHIAYIENTLINHRINIDNSVSNSLYKNNINYILALKELYDNLMKHDLYKYYKNSFEKYVIEFSKWQYNKNRHYNNKKKYRSRIKKFFRVYWQKRKYTNYNR